MTAILILFSCVHSFAQDYPRWESFTGFSYAHINLGAQNTTFQPTGNNRYGLHVNGSFNPRSYLRILLCDFSVQIGGTRINLAPEKPDVRTSQILFGPEFVWRSGKAAAMFADTLIGVTNSRLVSRIGGSDIVPDVVNHTYLAFGVGGGLDLHISHMFSIRAMQADYIPTRIAGNWENHFRASSGVLWTFDYRQPRKASALTKQ